MDKHAPFLILGLIALCALGSVFLACGFGTGNGIGSLLNPPLGPRMELLG